MRMLLKNRFNLSSKKAPCMPLDLTPKLDPTPDISKQLIFHDRVHYPLRIKSLCK